MIKIALHPIFDKFILLAITANCITIAIDHKTESEWATIAEIIFLSIFTLEMLLKIVAMGLAMNPHSYLRDG
jgi:hypothetical protein